MKQEKAMKYEISKEEVNELHRGGFDGEIVVIEDPEAAAREAKQLLDQETLLGFDTETRPTFTKGEKGNQPALLQLARPGKVYLFRLNKTGLLDPLAEILANESIIKAGIAIGRDIEELQELKPFKPAGFVDLNSYAQQKGFESVGVRNLTAMLLGFRVSKRQQTSNWEAEELKPAQIRYAATDAWVCREIYMKLVNHQ